MKRPRVLNRTKSALSRIAYFLSKAERVGVGVPFSHSKKMPLKNLCDKDFAELSCAFSGLICLKPLFH